MPFERSRSVLDNEHITKIPLWTGPQSIGGSTRMQASTSEQYVISILLEHAVTHALVTCGVSESDLINLGFETSLTIKDRLLSFIPIQESCKASAKQVSQFTELESRVYQEKKHSVYFAQDAMISIFTDLTERSPTFGLNPIDTIGTFPKRSWIAMFTNADSNNAAWLKFLGRPFKGLDSGVVEKPFTEITDADLRRRALNSLKNAGPDQ
jgi:hypothetical protein